MLYDAALLSDQYNEDEREAIATSLESTSSRIAVFSQYLFADASLVDCDKMSPFVPYSLYQSAVVQYRHLKQTGRANHQVNLDSLKMILTNFKKRWLIAGKYIDGKLSIELTKSNRETPGQLGDTRQRRLASRDALHTWDCSQ